MKHPNLIFALTVIFLMVVGVVNGQSATTHADKAARLTAAMQKRLKLNEQQTVKVTKVNLETITSLKNLKTAEYASQQERIAAIRNVRKNHVVELKKVLTTDQWNNYLVMQKEIRASKRNGRRGNYRRARSFGTNTAETELTKEELEELGDMDIFDDGEEL